MALDPDKLTSQEKFDHLLKVLASRRFLDKEGLGNEVPFFICHYLPQDQLGTDRKRQQLKNRLAQQSVTVLDINLYDLVVEILKKRGSWQRVLDNEPTISKEQLKELLQGMLDTERYLVPAICEKMAGQAFDVMFISGVGEVFPYIRSHNVLNNLQSKAKDRPTLMFFPGKYSHTLEDGASLDLFGRLHDDKYYRAFDIFNYAV